MTFCTYIFVVIQAIFTILTLLNRELGEEWNGVELVLLSTKESSQHVIKCQNLPEFMFTFPYLSLAYNLSWVFLNAFIL